MPTLNIGTLNIQSGVQTTKGYWQYPTTFWKYFFPHKQDQFLTNLSEFIASQQIDIITFAEIDGGSFRTKQINQLERISRRTGLTHHQFFQTSTLLGSNQGNGILSRYEILDVSHHKLVGNGESRFLSGARLNINGQYLLFFTTHLSLSKKNRRKQLEHIISLINNTRGPVILTGDFNTDDAEEIRLLDATRLDHLQIQPTYPSWQPIKCLDHLFYSDDLIVNQTAPTHIQPEIISDHLPILAQLSLVPVPLKSDTY